LFFFLLFLGWRVFFFFFVFEVAESLIKKPDEGLVW